MMQVFCKDANNNEGMVKDYAMDNDGAEETKEERWEYYLKGEEEESDY